MGKVKELKNSSNANSKRNHKKNTQLQQISQFLFEVMARINLLTIALDPLLAVM